MAYQPVDTSNDKLEAPSSSTQSSTSARFTPDFDSDDEDEAHRLRRLEDEEGYELKEINRPKWTEEAEDTFPGAEHDEDEEGSEDGQDVPLAGQRRRRRRESVQSFELYTPDEEKRVRRKLDVRLALFVSFLYLISFLDRTNIGV
jgi:hypothetical protein